MSKTKSIDQSTFDRAQEVAGAIGLTLMTAATVLGMVKLTNNRERLLPVAQPIISFPGSSDEGNNPNDMMRREREEESSSHYVSYGTTIRTPSRTGKQ